MAIIELSPAETPFHLSDNRKDDAGTHVEIGEVLASVLTHPMSLVHSTAGDWLALRNSTRDILSIDFIELVVPLDNAMKLFQLRYG